MKRDDSSPEAYIDAVEGDQKTLLLAVRELIFQVEPEAEEKIEYGMLGYTDLANLAAQKNYVSLYVTPAALAEYKKSHPKANCGKCCLRFSSLQKFEAEAVRRLLEEVVRIRESGGEVGC